MKTHPLKVLLLENNHDDALIFKSIMDDSFTHRECSIETTNSKNILNALYSHYDILFINDQPSIKKSIELALFIYSKIATAPPIILLTEKSSSSFSLAALEAGISECIDKNNITPQNLRRSILHAIARRKAQSTLHESKLHIQTMINSMQDGVLTSNLQGIISSVNPAAAKLFGYTEAELINTPIKKLIPNLLSKNSFYKKYIDTRTETEGLHKKENKLPIELSISEFTLDDTPMFTCIIHDISDRKIIESRVERQANFDELTDLPNRRLLLDRLERSFKTSSRYNSFGALLFLDLDNFKHLNDSLGHSIGDKLLQKVAKRLVEHVRSSDTVARLGGDEFVVILTELDQDEQLASTQAFNIAEKIREEIGRTYNLEGHDYHFTPSIGIALYPADNKSADDILRHADSAMYLAKSEGKDTIRFYEPAMQATADTRLQIEKELRIALNHNQFILHYQPQISSQGQLSGLEALIRWQHPSKGIVAPDDFLNVAEQACLMVKIGNWVINAAIQQFTEWRAQDLIPEKTVLAINISPSQFNDENFIPNILDSLLKFKLPAKNLLIEITENLMIQNIEAAISKMLVLKQQGILFSIDDFGTGYSSLQYLKRLPISQIKIDKQFVHDFTIDPNNAAIVEAILSMAHHFNLDVVAEGIEDQAELYFLQAKGCTTYQGYFFAKPLPADELKFFMLENAFHITRQQRNSQYLFDMSKAVGKKQLLR